MGGRVEEGGEEGEGEKKWMWRKGTQLNDVVEERMEKHEKDGEVDGMGIDRKGKMREYEKGRIEKK